MRKNIVILGSTGSIGKSALSLIKKFKNEFKVIGISAYENIKELSHQIKIFKPEYVAIHNEDKAEILKRKFKNIKILSGINGITFLSTIKKADIILLSIVGAAGIFPLLSAIKAGKKIALANKESLVIAGDIINKELKRYKAEILPVDSEHSAIFQALQGQKKEFIKKIILTASGGPFFEKDKKDLRYIKSEEALRHPTWKMGKKITIDSATLVNKGLEVIEAHYLFDLPYEKIDVVIHPQSIVHSMVEFIDGSIIAQISKPDMKLPIMYALTYPERKKSVINSLDLKNGIKLDFKKIDKLKFRGFFLAVKAGKIGGTMPSCMNAANEVAVKNFIEGKLTFDKIPFYIEKAMNSHRLVKNPTLEDILKTDSETRKKIKEMIENG